MSDLVKLIYTHTCQDHAGHPLHPLTSYPAYSGGTLLWKGSAPGDIIAFCPYCGKRLREKAGHVVVTPDVVASSSFVHYVGTVAAS